MKIAIIVHSSTGTTRALAERIMRRLDRGGMKSDLIQLITDVPVKSGSIRSCPRFKITNLPTITGYDILLVGGPVWAFSASPVIVKCISSLGDLSEKKVLPFVTMGFPLKRMGGTSAISTMGKTAAKCGATVLRGVIARKMFHELSREMDCAAESIMVQLQQED